MTVDKVRLGKVQLGNTQESLNVVKVRLGKARFGNP